VEITYVYDPEVETYRRIVEEHETSYFAASLNILNFSSIDLLIISPYPLNDTLLILV